MMSKKVISHRVDIKTTRLIELLSSQLSIPKSEVIEKAVQNYVETEADLATRVAALEHKYNTIEKLIINMAPTPEPVRKIYDHDCKPGWSDGLPYDATTRMMISTGARTLPSEHQAVYDPEANFCYSYDGHMLTKDANDLLIGKGIKESDIQDYYVA